MLHGKIHTLFRDDQASTYRGNQMIRSLQGVRNICCSRADNCFG